MRPTSLLALLALLALPACSSSSSGTGGAASGETGVGTTACDPFALATKPISLGAVIAAGRRASGTLYVVDETPTHDNHVFVSNEGTLVRQRIAGSGSSPDFYVFQVQDHVPPFFLQIDLQAGAPVAMGLLEGALPDGSKTFQIGKDGETLTLVAAADVASMPTQNLPGAQFLEYDARLDDGREIVVVRPLDDWTYEDFRVFFGAPPALAERHVKNVSRGSDTYITFDLDGAEAQAVFTWMFSPDGGSGPGGATLTVNGASQELTLQPTDAPPKGLAYTCFGP